MSKMKEEFCRQQDLKALQPDAPDDSDYDAPDKFTGRLLSVNEQIEAHGCSVDNHECTDALLSAQLDKADREWVEWSNERCPHFSTFKIKRECEICWQKRKKEIGIESTT